MRFLSHHSSAERYGGWNASDMAARRKAQPARLRCQANARERDRTLSVNTAFGTLRRLIPTEPADRKLSKIETLKLATSYVKHLLSLLVYEGVNDRRISRTNDCSFCTNEQYHSNRVSKATASTASKSNGSTYSLVPSDMSHCL